MKWQLFWKSPTSECRFFEFWLRLTQARIRLLTLNSVCWKSWGGGVLVWSFFCLVFGVVWVFFFLVVVVGFFVWFWIGFFVWFGLVVCFF